MIDVVTSTQARDLYGVPGSRVRYWAHCGRIERVGYRGRSPVYPIDRLRELNRLANLDPRSGPRA